ncbi:MAG: phytanoyl-CoA dioxygenase family protein [Paracoccaceae bacterium]
MPGSPPWDGPATSRTAGPGCGRCGWSVSTSTRAPTGACPGTRIGSSPFARAEVPGFSNWSCKQDIWHCEPPRALLERMLFVRVHLDACDAENGAMEIARGSHRLGPVPAGEAAGAAKSFEPEVTAAAPGDVLVLPMLVLHRSLPSQSEGARRVLRVDFADFDLPEPLRWADG